MTSPEIWYVSYCPDDGPDGASRRVRVTRRFRSETEAKQFAQEIISSNHTVLAGTLNPHKPRRVVGSHSVLDWIAEREK